MGRVSRHPIISPRSLVKICFYTYKPIQHKAQLLHHTLFLYRAAEITLKVCSKVAFVRFPNYSYFEVGIK